jgi:hypothetical protein
LLILVHHIWLLLFLAPVLFFLCKVKASRWQENIVALFLLKNGGNLPHFAPVSQSGYSTIFP